MVEVGAPEALGVLQPTSTVPQCGGGDSHGSTTRTTDCGQVITRALLDRRKSTVDKSKSVEGAGCQQLSNAGRRPSGLTINFAVLALSSYKTSLSESQTIGKLENINPVLP